MVVGSFIKAQGEALAGSDLMASLSLASGTLYPLLRRLEAAGWLISEWETGDPVEMGRPRKHFYIMTEKGQSEGLQEIQNLRRFL